MGGSVETLDTSTVDRGSRSKRPTAANGGAADDPASGVATLKEGAVAAGRARTAEGFLTEAVEQLARLIGSGYSSILLLEGNHLHHAASKGLPADYVEAVDGLEIGPEVGSCGSAAFTGETQITEDIETDPRWEPLRELALTSGLRSCWSVPLVSCVDCSIVL